MVRLEVSSGLVGERWDGERILTLKSRENPGVYMLCSEGEVKKKSHRLGREEKWVGMSRAGDLQ